MTKVDNKSLFQFEVTAIFLVAISSIVSLVIPFPSDIIIDIQLALYLVIVLLNYIRIKSFNLYQVWIISYIFIIWSEMRIISSTAIDSQYIIPFVRFTLSNCAVLIGYITYRRRNRKEIGINYVAKTNQLFTIIIVVLYVAYIGLSAQSAINSYSYGRSLSSAKGSSTLSGALIAALGTILPSIIAYHQKIVKKKSDFICLLYVFPIFAIMLLQATRYRFLFSVIPFLIVIGVFNFGSTSKRKNLLLICIVFLLLGVSSFVKENRNAGFAEIENPVLFATENVNANDAIPLKIAKIMSPEGTVRMGYVADRYFENHSLHYGKELSFILYFWVPRAIWPSKPTQLDYWLIREYSSESIAASYSSASGFIGEARADFGWGCVFLSFLFGMLIKRIDEYKTIIFNSYNKSYNIVLISILVPWIFFFVRSPLTSTMSLLWELLIYYVFLKLFTYKVKDKR